MLRFWFDFLLIIIFFCFKTTRQTVWIAAHVKHCLMTNLQCAHFTKSFWALIWQGKAELSDLLDWNVSSVKAPSCNKSGSPADPIDLGHTPSNWYTQCTVCTRHQWLESQTAVRCVNQNSREPNEWWFMHANLFDYKLFNKFNKLTFSFDRLNA